MVCDYIELSKCLRFESIRNILERYIKRQLRAHRPSNVKRNKRTSYEDHEDER